MQETVHLTDAQAENAVLCGILHEPNEMFRELSKINLTVSDFGNHDQLVTFRILKELWTHGDRIELPVLWNCLNRERELGGWKRSAQWIAFLWTYCWWDDRAMFFWVESNLSTGYGQRGLAAAGKVRWLGARRNAIHRANQVIADAVSGAYGPEHFEETI